MDRSGDLDADGRDGLSPAPVVLGDGVHGKEAQQQVLLGETEHKAEVSLWHSPGIKHELTADLTVKRESTAAAAAAKSFQSCPTLCNPIDGSPPGSPIPGILQARTREWVAISFSNA